MATDRNWRGTHPQSAQETILTPTLDFSRHTRDRLGIWGGLSLRTAVGGEAMIQLSGHRGGGREDPTGTAIHRIKGGFCQQTRP